MNIPVYVIAGFLDAGKTQFINGTLADGFARKDRTLLIRCEEGEEEYDPALLRNVTVVDVEDEEDLTREFLQECEKKYRPRQVMVEYNGMWQLETLWNEALPPNWFIVQTFTFVEASTFELYARNMAQQTMDKVKNADVLVFNRCDDTLAEALRSRNLRMTNRRAQIYLEYEDGTSEDYLTGDECPFDLDQPVIDIPDEDFGVWYVDVMDHPDRYSADILWFTKGFVEYNIPNFIPSFQKITQLTISAELSSEAPGVNNVWPSDISFYLNDVCIGNWLSPGDFGDSRGLFTPDWWFPNWNQYGLLKLLVINREGTFIDGLQISDVTIDSFKLDFRSSLRLRLAVEDNARYIGGLTIFGKSFGNYGQDIKVNIHYGPIDEAIR